MAKPKPEMDEKVSLPDEDFELVVRAILDVPRERDDHATSDDEDGSEDDSR